MSSPVLPPTMKALVSKASGQPLLLETVSTPTVVSGSCVIKVLAVAATGSTAKMLTGSYFFTHPWPYTPGGAAIGRVVAVGSDAALLVPGQLVFADIFARARDDPNVQILLGVFDGPSPASKRFMADNWNMGTYAEYARLPLENVYALDEARLLGTGSGGFGYAPADLLQLGPQLPGFSALRSIGVQAGERVIVAPATGTFSGATVQCAVAMGAQVIAVGRSLDKLQALQAAFPAGRVQVVAVTGDVQADAEALKQWGPVDAFVDVSPPAANDSPHIRSCFLALRQYGRVALAGIVTNDVAVSYALAVWQNLTIRGVYMYERDLPLALIRMVESGVLKLGKEGGNEIVGTFTLEKADEALEVALAKSDAFGKTTVLTPSLE